LVGSYIDAKIQLKYKFAIFYYLIRVIPYVSHFITTISGQFGIVNKAHLVRMASGQSHSIVVAAKMIKGECNKDFNYYFIQGNNLNVSYLYQNKYFKCHAHFKVFIQYKPIQSIIVP